MVDEPTIKMPKRVTVEEADNGYIVSTYSEKGRDEKIVCKNRNEAMEAIGKMMGMKMQHKNPKEKMVEMMAKK